MKRLLPKKPKEVEDPQPIPLAESNLIIQPKAELVGEIISVTKHMAQARPIGYLKCVVSFGENSETVVILNAFLLSRWFYNGMLPWASEEDLINSLPGMFLKCHTRNMEHEGKIYVQINPVDIRKDRITLELSPL